MFTRRKILVAIGIAVAIFAAFYTGIFNMAV
jgi:hypothetical protein